MLRRLPGVGKPGHKYLCCIQRGECSRDTVRCSLHQGFVIHIRHQDVKRGVIQVKIRYR